MMIRKTSQEWFHGNKSSHFLLYGPNKELHRWKLGQPVSQVYLGAGVLRLLLNMSFNYVP